MSAPAVAARATSAGPARRPPRSGPVIAAAAVALAVLVGGWWWGWGRWSSAEPAVGVVAAYAGPSAGGSAAVYLTLDNAGGPDRVVDATSPAAAEVVVHASMGDAMSPLGDIDLPARATVALRPGGDHLMLEGLDRPLVPGDVVTVELRLDRSPPLALEAPVLTYPELAERAAP